MMSLLNKDAYDTVIVRLGALSPESKAQWGKMNVGQMLAHLKVAFGVPLSDVPLKRMPAGYLFAWMFRKSLYSEKPWKKNLPTAPNFIITGAREFEKERTELIELVTRFYQRGAGNIGKYPHPFFGMLSDDQWGVSMYKHIDHHLQQFGV